MSASRTSRGLFAAAIATWAAWCAFGAGESVSAWGAAISAWRAAEFLAVSPAGLAGAAARHGAVVLLAALFALGLANAGGAAALLILPRRAPPGERLLLGVLLAFALLGAWYFGFALAGLFYPEIVLGSAAAFVAFPGWRRLAAGCRSSWRAAAGAWGSLPEGPARWMVAAAALSVAPALLGTLVPDTQVDTYTYHLAGPELFLRLHKFSPEWTSTALQCPLTAEMVYALGVVVGLDALPHLLELVPFAAAVALLAGWCSRTGGPAAGWLCALGAATFGLVGQQALVAKNDLAAAAYPVAGFVCLLRGAGQGRGRWWPAAAALFGCAAAVKYNGYVLAAVAWGLVAALARGARWRTAFRWLVVFSVPVLPWLAKSWYLFGDPLWPLTSVWLKGALWDPASAASLAMRREAADGPGAAIVGGIGAVAGALRAYHPAVAAAVPLALVGAAGRAGAIRLVLAFSLGAAVVLHVAIPAEGIRLALPAFLLLLGGVAAALPAVRLRGIARPAGMAAGVVACWLPAGSLLSGPEVAPGTMTGYLTGSLGPQEHLAAKLTTYGEAGAAMRDLPGLDRVIVIGDIRFYRLPGRAIAERTYGRNWGWVLARECSAPVGIRKRLRQMNCRHVLYNFVTEGFPHEYAAPFEWDDRMLELWLEFVSRHLEVAVAPERVDHANGGFCVYRLRESPLECPSGRTAHGQAQYAGGRRPTVRMPCTPGHIPYLPGVESLYLEVTRFFMHRNVREFGMDAHRLYARLPVVDYVSDMLGRAYQIQGRFRLAHEFLSIGAGHGTLGDFNYHNLGLVAAALGRFEEAAGLMRVSMERYPELRAGAAETIEALKRAAAVRGR